MSNTREQYWNGQYVDYWKARVDEANQPNTNSKLVQNDVVAPSDRVYLALIELLGITPESRILEMGCGFGRTIPWLYKQTHNIDAIDISERMINLAVRECSKFASVAFQACEAEKTPFDNERFDAVICFGVFDALFQNEALLEMNRVLKVGGRAMITGKNDLYLPDDGMALVAERNARAKGHPNYFTNVRELLEKQSHFGFEVVHQRFFLRRGDMAQNLFTTILPERFYEYALILQKQEKSHAEAKNLELSRTVSKTFDENPFRL